LQDRGLSDAEVRELRSDILSEFVSLVTFRRRASTADNKLYVITVFKTDDDKVMYTSYAIEHDQDFVEIPKHQGTLRLVPYPEPKPLINLMERLMMGETIQQALYYLWGF
jgi:hypothetical protein